MPIAQEEIDRERALAEQPEEKRSSPVPLVASTPKQSHENVVKKPPIARPRSGKKKTSRPSSTKSLSEENFGWVQIFQHKFCSFLSTCAEHLPFFRGNL